MPTALTWPQVNSWRLDQHFLSHRLKHHDIVKAAKRICGVQAQLMSAAELSLWARTDGLQPSHVQAALWEDHTLLKIWAMRGTLHLMSTKDLPLYAAARSDYDNRNWPDYFAYYGISNEVYEAYLDAVAGLLSDEPVTREQLANAVAEHVNVPALREMLVESSWGSPFKPPAFRGDLCFGPNQGRNITFVNPAKWIGKHPTLDTHEALQEIVRRYLAAYGPARLEDFSLWWWGGGGIGHARKLFKSMGDELEEVEIEGWRGIALRKTAKQIQESEPSSQVNLLPLFDTYVIGSGRDIESMLPKAFKSKVFRPQGWITATVLVGGMIKGVWE